MDGHKFNKLQRNLIQKWQAVHFEQETASDAYAKADCLRTAIGHLEFAYATGSTSQATLSPLSDLLQNYSSIIDTEDPSHGVNNYAEGALKLAESNKSGWFGMPYGFPYYLNVIRNQAVESISLPKAMEWKSELDVHKICNEDFVLKFISSAKGDNHCDTSASPTFAEAMKPRIKAACAPRIVYQQGFASRSEKSTSDARSSSLHPKIPPSVQQSSMDESPISTPLASRNFFGSVGQKRMAPAADAEAKETSGLFCTAKEQLIRENQKKNNSNSVNPTTSSYGSVKKSLGARRGPSSKFVPPVLGRGNENHSLSNSGMCEVESKNSSKVNCTEAYDIEDENLKNIEPRMVELILNEILDQGPPVSWEDIAGLEFAKATIQEIVVWPMLRPDIFTGLRGPPKGLLLFGPPGTGKTLIGKCIASQSGATFFSISASSLTSKWIGEGEKMVRTLFAVARSRQPAVVFIDEIDSLLTQRSESEHESSRRMKTEFLVQLDGATTSKDERILVVGATNRPQELDEAARRRLVKRLYIPLPDLNARYQIVLRLLEKQHTLTDDQIQDICSKTKGYSGADVANLCREAALGPIRCLTAEQMQYITPNQVRPILYEDCVSALDRVKASVCEQDLVAYIEWNIKFGCGNARYMVCNKFADKH